MPKREGFPQQLLYPLIKSDGGFSIVEAIVASFILLTAIAISLSLFTFSSKNSGQIERSQNEKNAIEADAANIQRINDQFSCSSATSSSTCGVNTRSADYPGEDQYIPNSYTEASEVQSWLKEACLNGLGDELANYINANQDASLIALGIIRSASVASSDSSPHLYEVHWMKSGTTLKRITLYPTVAAWCP